ncbi:MAG TPA: hypothetical protein VIM77_07310 [Mucilaginibacter sp.]
MEESEAILQTYGLIKTALTEKFGSEGYLIAGQEENDPVFGSMYTLWSNNADVIRLTWDGKENIFVVEVTNDLPITPLTSWTSISITAFDRQYKNSKDIYDTAQKVIKSID